MEDMKRTITINKDTIIVICMVLIAIIQSSALYSNVTTLSTDLFRLSIRIVAVFLLLIAGGYSIILGRFIKSVWLALIPLSYLLLSFLDYHSGDLPIFTVLTIIVYILMPSKRKQEIYEVFRTVIVISSFIGIVCYLFFHLNIFRYYEIIPYYTGEYAAVYISYKFIYLYVSESMNFVRLCGFMNEPGMFGTFLALLLCADKLDFRKKSNIVMFIAGCFTFSMAFFCIVFIYFILTLLNTNERRVALLIVLLVCFTIFSFILPNINLGEGNIARLISRLSFSEGFFYGDNRTNSVFDKEFDAWLNSSHLLFGYGRGYKDVIGENFSTFKSYLIEFGIIGFIIIYVPLLLHCLVKTKRNFKALIFVFCFFLSIYQRPNIYSLAYFILLLGGLEMYNLGEKNEEKDFNKI